MMTLKTRKLVAGALVAGLILSLGGAAQAADKRYTIGSLAEGTTPFIVNTAWANAP